MKQLKNISIVFLAMVFLVSSSGYVMYKTNCSCTGEEQTSVFVRPDTCEDDFHQHHKHDDSNAEIACCEHECHECESHTKSCGCDSPEFFFFKLKDKAVDDEVKFVATQAIQLAVTSSDLLPDLLQESEDKDTGEVYTDPPCNLSTSLDFLLKIQQLKIPSLA